MERNIKFSVESVQKVSFDEYPDYKFGVAKTCFLSTKKNTHGLDIKEDILREHAKSILGNFLVAKMSNGDATSHMSDEVIMGYFPKEQDVEFEEVEDNNEKILKAYAYAVISKQYAKSFYDIFVADNKRNTSVEMKVTTPEDDETNVLSFDIYGLTCLGKWVNGSCPDANMTMVRFSENEADEFFNKVHTDHLTVLKTFAKKRRENMAESKTYKVDKSKEALSDKSWGEVDKTDLRNKILEASNKASLVKDVYMLVEPDWEEAPSEKLKYPVMSFNGDTLVYNRDGLASALGYAKKENETTVVSKVEKIYKKLDLDDGKEEDKKMAKEIEFAAVNIGDMWSNIWDALHTKYPDGEYGSVYRIDGIYEEGNKKFVLIKRKDEDTLYRLDFSYTEKGLELSDEITKVEIEIVETDEIRKFAEPEDADKFKKFDEDDDDDDDDDEIEGRKAWAKVIKKVQDHEKGAYVDSIEKNHIIYTKDDIRYRVEADVKTNPDDKTVDATIDWKTVKKDSDQKMSEDEMMAELAKMKSEIEARDNIIMEKDKELEELRAFKKAEDDKQKAMSVEATMEDVKDCFETEKFKELRDEGLACDTKELDAWANKVKSFAFESVKNGKKKINTNGIWSFSAVTATNTETTTSMWK